MPDNQSDQIREILESVRTIALVGASNKVHRPSHEVMAFMQRQGYRMMPVNPRLAGEQLLGETVYGSLEDLPEKPDMVEIFLASGRTDAVIDSAISLGIPVIWMQVGVINRDGARRAEQAGQQVIMDRCPKQEIPRLGIRPVTDNR